MGREKTALRDPILVAFGLTIQRRRHQMGLSQEEIAARAGVHRTYFADVERGTRNVGLRNIVAIARGLGIKTSDLLKGV